MPDTIAPSSTRTASLCWPSSSASRSSGRPPRKQLPTRALLPDVPWPGIVAMRHRLVHAYFDVDLDLVWATVTDDLPPLVALLEQHLDQPACSEEDER